MVNDQLAVVNADHLLRVLVGVGSLQSGFKKRKHCFSSKSIAVREEWGCIVYEHADHEVKRAKGAQRSPWA